MMKVNCITYISKQKISSYHMKSPILPVIRLKIESKSEYRVHTQEKPSIGYRDAQTHDQNQNQNNYRQRTKTFKLVFHM